MLQAERTGGPKSKTTLSVASDSTFHGLPPMNSRSPAVGKRASIERNTWSSYFLQSRRPIVSLVFVIPILLMYEVGILLLGPQAMRNGADLWLRHFLDATGFGQYFLLPLLTVFSLLAWHHVTHEPWKFSPRLLGLMLAESALFSVILLGFVQFQGRMMEISQLTVAIQSAEQLAWAAKLKQIVGYFGAGIYEELLFRLLLLPLLTVLIRGLGVTTTKSLLAAIVLSGLFFSAAHYQVFTSVGDTFEWFSFTFRFVAGIFFAILFTYRGFGIAVGTHTLYDVLVVTIQGG